MKSHYKTCLLIEDDPEDQDFFISALQNVSSGTGCYAVANGQEALYALQEEGVSPDYIFTDIQMPRMNGLEFLKEIKTLPHLSNIPVVVYSSTYCEEQAMKVKMLGATAFYSKTSFKSLTAILQGYFGQPRSYSIL